MNLNIRKYFFIIISILLLVLLTTLAFYIVKFNGGLSSDHSYWGDFGSYFGGVVGPLATIITLIWLLILNSKQWQQSIQQIEKVEKERSINNLEVNLRSIIEKLQSLKEIKINPSNYYLLIEQLRQLKSTIVNYERKENEIIVSKKNGMVEILGEEDVFSILNFTAKNFSPSIAKKYIFDDNLISQKHIILGFLGQMSYLIGYLTRLKTRGYDQFSVKYILSLYDAYYKQLFDVGLVEPLHYKHFMILRDFPFVGEKIKTEIDSEVYHSILNKDKKYNNLNIHDIKLIMNYMNKDSYETKYVFYIPSTNEYYAWESTKLNKVDEEYIKLLKRTNLNV